MSMHYEIIIIAGVIITIVILMVEAMIILYYTDVYKLDIVQGLVLIMAIKFVEN